MKSSIIRSTLALTLVSLFLQSVAMAEPSRPVPRPTLPKDAFGYGNEKLPAGAVEISNEEFNRLMAMKRFKVLNPGQIKRDHEADTASRRRHADVVSRLLKSHPELHAKIHVPLDMDRIRATGDGNFYLPLKEGCRDLAKCPHIVTLGNQSRLQSIAHAAEKFPSRENEDIMYGHLHSLLMQFNRANPRHAIRVIGGVQVSQMPVLEKFRQMSERDRTHYLGLFQNSAEAIEIANRVIHIPIPADPDQHLKSCVGNLGYAHDEDRLARDFSATPDDAGKTAQCANFSEQGVMAHYDFPMKPYLTCVKNQQNRGTCWAFSLASMLEAAYARDHKTAGGRPVFMNLSEQDLTNMVKLVWWPTQTSYGDAAGSDILGRMVTEGYTMPYENNWVYNQSRSRTADDATMTYSHSCVGYTGVCSETNHQGRMVCSRFGLFRYCSFVTVDVDETHGVKPSAASQLWDATNADRSVAMALLGVIFNTPMQLGFDVFPEFDNAVNGWVLPPQGGGKSRGGHFVHIVGYISNEKIAATPAIASQIHDASTGGGYFIVKNSWSTCYGDGGYYYVPISWLKAHTWSIVALSGIQK